MKSRAISVVCIGWKASKLSLHHVHDVSNVTFSGKQLVTLAQSLVGKRRLPLVFW